MTRSSRLRVEIEDGIKPHFKAKCAIAGISMSRQAEALMWHWIESEPQDLTNQARISIGSKQELQEELQIEINEDIKVQFAGKCAAERVTMGKMLEVLILYWVNA